ncbi:RING-H2 finger protein ATL1-like [Amaranthus tricolor]|uniref:RING-H2 finger protein ATL1-like n=1 Tax=Amaranthus tricolor TaxID=29722 RepID=UPI00258F3B4F|nr:RING-H2 finger protein ATL1-like [Amaranthus tricolor]
MSSFDKSEFFYIAGVGLLLNIILFATTFIVYICKTKTQNTDIESLNHHHLDVALLHQQDEDHITENHEENHGLKLIDLIPAMKFMELSKGRDPDSIRGSGCSICLREGYEDDEMCKVLPECDHVFHSDCIDQWFMKKQSCPVCRKIFWVVLPTV